MKINTNEPKKHLVLPWGAEEVFADALGRFCDPKRPRDLLSIPETNLQWAELESKIKNKKSNKNNNK